MAKHRMFAFVLAVALLLTGCKSLFRVGGETSGTTEGQPKPHVLALGSGELSDEKRRNAIKEYQEHYTPFASNEEDGISAISFETDFTVLECCVLLLSKVDDSDINIEMEGQIDSHIETKQKYGKVTVDIDWWYASAGWTKEYPMWSYFVRVVDAFGTVNYYYFRVNYITQKRPDEKYFVSDDVLRGLYVNGALYIPDENLSKTAGAEHVGDFIGYVSYDNQTQTGISAFRYLPDDGQTNRIIVYDETYCVYAFETYTPDGTDSWPIKLLRNAAYVEISGSNHPLKGPGKSVTITDTEHVEQIVTFLSDLGEKHSREEVERRYYELFKDRFLEDEVWVNERGWISTRDVRVHTALSEMICKNERAITVVMDDYTKLFYFYQPASSLIICHDFAYFLNDVQIEQVKQFAAWK